MQRNEFAFYSAARGQKQGTRRARKFAGRRSSRSARQCGYSSSRGAATSRTTSRSATLLSISLTGEKEAARVVAETEKTECASGWRRRAASVVIGEYPKRAKTSAQTEEHPEYQADPIKDSTDNEMSRRLRSRCKQFKPTN